MPPLLYIAAITASIANIASISAYYRQYGQTTEHLYVSDLLFTLLPYRVLMCVLNGMQIMFCLDFAWRIPERWLFAFELFGLAMCAAGWTALNSMYRDPSDDAITAGHLIGTGFYVAGNLINFIFMLRVSSPPERYLLALVILGSIGVGVAFLVGFFQKDAYGADCEHWTLILVAIAHCIFFASMCRPTDPPPATPKCTDVRITPRPPPTAQTHTAASLPWPTDWRPARGCRAVPPPS